MPILHTKHRCISFIDGMLTLYATSRTISSCMSIARAFVSFRFRPSSQYVVFGGGANISSMCLLCVCVFVWQQKRIRSVQIRSTRTALNKLDWLRTIVHCYSVVSWSCVFGSVWRYISKQSGASPTSIFWIACFVNIFFLSSVEWIWRTLFRNFI